MLWAMRCASALSRPSSNRTQSWLLIVQCLDVSGKFSSRHAGAIIAHVVGERRAFFDQIHPADPRLGVMVAQDDLRRYV